MKAIVNGRIVLPHAIETDKALLFDKKIWSIMNDDNALAQADEIIDAQGAYVCPGLVDVHIHGYLGADVSDGDKAGIKRMAQGIVKNGVTSFLPTTMTIPWNELEKAFEAVRELKPESEAGGWDGAQILGVHAEGPFINKNKKGAQAESAILKPDIEKVLPYQDIIKLITVAPEVEGGMDFVRDLRQKTDIFISIGHTDATYEEAVMAMHAGVTHVTHTFNAMTPLVHRNPGVVGAALTEDVYCELIADTFHVHPGIYQLLTRDKRERLVLITDCVRAGGMPDGQYTLGGQPIFLKGIECRMADGTIAGSVLKLNRGVKNLRDNAALSMQTAIRMASLNPANSIGVGNRKGSLEAGKDADIVLMNEECDVLKTFVRGNCVYTA